MDFVPYFDSIFHNLCHILQPLSQDILHVLVIVFAMVIFGQYIVTVHGVVLKIEKLVL